MSMCKGRRAAKSDDKEQSRLFIEKARELGADDERSAADEILGRLARQAPAPHGRSLAQNATN